MGPRSLALLAGSACVRKEFDLNWNKSLRQFHRWLSIAFVLTVVVVSVSAAAVEAPTWVFLTPLLPLLLLSATGLYLFVLPYAARRRRT